MRFSHVQPRTQSTAKSAEYGWTYSSIQGKNGPGSVTEHDGNENGDAAEDDVASAIIAERDIGQYFPTETVYSFESSSESNPKFVKIWGKYDAHYNYGDLKERSGIRAALLRHDAC